MAHICLWCHIAFHPKMARRLVEFEVKRATGKDFDRLVREAKQKEEKFPAVKVTVHRATNKTVYDEKRDVLLKHRKGTRDKVRYSL